VLEARLGVDPAFLSQAVFCGQHQLNGLLQATDVQLKVGYRLSAIGYRLSAIGYRQHDHCILYGRIAIGVRPPKRAFAALGVLLLGCIEVDSVVRLMMVVHLAVLGHAHCQAFTPAADCCPPPLMMYNFCMYAPQVTSCASRAAKDSTRLMYPVFQERLSSLVDVEAWAQEGD
jgi:hypothetical protein